MNTQHTQNETVSATDWEVPAGFIGGLVYAVAVGFIVGNIALATGNIKLVLLALSIAGTIVVLIAWLMHLHHVYGIKSEVADRYRADSTKWALGWCGTIFIGMLFGWWLVESFYQMSYTDGQDGSAAFIAGGIVGIIAFAIWTALLFARPGGGIGKWIRGSLLFLLAQALPIGIAMTVGWRDAGHFF